MKKQWKFQPCAVDKEKFKHTWKVIDDIGEFPYHISLFLPISGSTRLNHVWMDLIEVYGFPEDRYKLSNNGPTRTTILFKTEQDLLFFKLKWSEYEL